MIMKASPLNQKVVGGNLIGDTMEPDDMSAEYDYWEVDDYSDYNEYWEDGDFEGEEDEE